MRLTTFALLCALAACNEPAAEKEPPAAKGGRGLTLKPGSPELGFLKVEMVKASLNAPTITLAGKVAFDEDHTQRVSSPIDGRVRAVLVKLGDHVKPGQPLITLSSPQVAQLLSDAQKADLDLTVSQKSFDRATKLRADGAISEREYAQVQADFSKAKSDVARAQAQLKALGITPGDATVTGTLHAEVAATVVQRDTLVGQEVRADAPTPLLTISDLSTVWALGEVYEQDLALIHPGASAQVRVLAYPDLSFKGTVAYVGDVVDPSSRTLRVRCLVPNPDWKLKPDMFAKIDVTTAENRLTIGVPARAVLNDGDKSQVVASKGDGVFTLREVEIGPEVDGRVQILKGLTEGDFVVTDGALFAKQEIQQE